MIRQRRQMLHVAVSAFLIAGSIFNDLPLNAQSLTSPSVDPIFKTQVLAGALLQSPIYSFRVVLSAVLRRSESQQVAKKGLSNYPAYLGKSPIHSRIINVSDYFMVGSGYNQFGSGSVLPQRITQSIAVELARQNLIGCAKNDTDKKIIEQKKEAGDLVAQKVQDRVAQLFKVLLEHFSFETKGEINGGTQAMQRTGDIRGRLVALLSDVIENTSAFAKGLIGASSVHMQGNAVKVFGSFPDRARAMMVVAHIDRSREAGVLKQYPGHTLETFLDPLLPADLLVERIAALNGVTANVVDVTVLANEVQKIDGKENLKTGREYGQLARLQSQHPEMRIFPLSGGTVRPAKIASLGLRNQRIQVFIGRSGMTEAEEQAVQSSIFNSEGSIAFFRVVSRKIKEKYSLENLRDWDTFPPEEKISVREELVDVRFRSGKSDADDILNLKKIFSSRMIHGEDAAGAYTFITDSDSPQDQRWPMKVRGVHEIRPGVFRVSTLHFLSASNGEKKGHLWLTEDDYDTRPALQQWRDYLSNKIPDLTHSHALERMAV